MSKVEVMMPKLGESVMEATITKWLVEVGETIEADQPIVEIATDKVDSEVPAPSGGVISQRLFNEGDVVKIGDIFAVIETDAANAGADVTPPVEKKPEQKPAPEVLEAVEAPLTTASQQTYVHTGTNGTGSSKFFSPLVRTIAEKENISVAELESIQGTGLEGRVTKHDVLNYIKSGKKSSGQPVKQQETLQQVQQPVQTQKITEVVKPAISISGNDQIIEMDRMRKMIANHMVMSKQTSPHVTSFVEADVTNLVRWRDKVKDEFQKKYGEKLTFTPMMVEAIVQAIKEFPGVNASVDGDRIIIKGRINIGMATALPSGNLIVPVIKNADQMNLFGLTKAVNDLAARARNNKLLPDEVADGTYTVSNVGTFGNVMGTPIINQPQVAIMAVGAIRKRPAVIETEDGDVIAIRHMMFLSHSYDHRVVDGALGGMFVRRVADLLEEWDIHRSI